jgi:hypothetical protein
MILAVDSTGEAGSLHKGFFAGFQAAERQGNRDLRHTEDWIG